MSRDYGVYLHTDNLPTPAAWKKEILLQGFPCVLDDDIDLLTFNGFLPCSVNGEVSGFEYYGDELGEDLRSELNSLSPLNYGITFCAGSRKFETVAALAAASCLATITGGYLVDFFTGLKLTSDTAIKWAKSQSVIVTGETPGR